MNRSGGRGNVNKIFTAPACRSLPAAAPGRGLWSDLERDGELPAPTPPQLEKRPWPVSAPGTSGRPSAKDIHGIGFKTADQIAQTIGIPHDSLIRACAGLSHVLLGATGNGHCALPVETLKAEAGKLLLVKEEIVNAALERTLAGGDLVQEKVGDEDLVFLPSLKRAEEGIAARIKFLAAAPASYPAIDLEKAVAWCQARTGKELAPSQQAALRQALSSRALILTGGPGVGKTTLVNPILLILRAKKVRCLLCRHSIPARYQLDMARRRRARAQELILTPVGLG